MQIAIIIAGETAALVALLSATPVAWVISRLASDPQIAKFQMVSASTIVAMYFLIMFVPLGVGAYRGARYKTYYDLAFFAERLPSNKRDEVAQYIGMIADDYRGKDLQETRHVVTPA